MTTTSTLRRRCPHCGSRPTWRYVGTHDAGGIVFCGPCGWIGRYRVATGDGTGDDAPIRLVAEAGGPGGAAVPSPWAGIYRLAAVVSPWVTWEPADAPCRGCGKAAIVRGLRENTKRGRFLILREHRSSDGGVFDYRIDARTLRVLDKTEVDQGNSEVRTGIVRWRTYTKVPPTPVTRPVCR